MFKIKFYNNGLVSGFWQYPNALKNVDYDLPRTYVSPKINTDMFVVQNLEYGSLIECSQMTEFDNQFDWAVSNSNEVNFKYKLYGRSLIYILDTNLSISEKIGFRSADQDKFYTGFFDNDSIKLTAITKLFDDDGSIELYNSTNKPNRGDSFESIYVFSTHQYYRFARNSKYLVCFGLGEPFK